MDVRVEEVRPPLLPSWFPRRRRPSDPSDRVTSAGTRTRAEVLSRVARPEWALTIFALLVFGRLPVLFLRRHLAEVFGGPPSEAWHDDLVVTLTFATVELVVVAVAVWRARASAWLRQPLLLLLLGWAWLTTAWSVEPAVSARRSLLFIGAAAVGWFIGDRFSIHDHMRLVSAMGAAVLATTVIALIFWNQAATTTNGNPKQWSGMHVNRNALGLALGLALMATMLLIRTTDRKRGLRVLAIVLFLLLARTQTRTALFAAVIALGVAALTHRIRRSRGSVLRVGPAAYVVLATLATIGLVVHWYWYDVLRFFGRDPDLSGRSLIWQLVRWFSDLRPWTGFGFEAIWTHEYSIGQAQAAHGSLRDPVPGGWPFSAHNGYYELMVGIGRVGLLLMILFLAVVLWRAFRHAWLGTDAVSLWPLSFVVFALVVNFSESLFVSSETIWVMTVATAFALREYDYRFGASESWRERARQLLRLRLS